MRVTMEAEQRSRPVQRTRIILVYLPRGTSRAAGLKFALIARKLRRAHLRIFCA